MDSPSVNISIEKRPQCYDTEDKQAAIFIKRPAYQLKEINTIASYKYQATSVRNVVYQKFKSFYFSSCFLNTLPILQWLSQYNWKKDLPRDLIAGTAIAVMHVSQGMSYALVAHLPPIVGIYMSFFPVLIFSVFSTSRHVSVGSFSITCLMAGKTVLQHSVSAAINQHNDTTHILNDATQYTGIQVASTLTFTVAIWQFLMWVSRLGIVSTLMSETFLNAYACGAAFQVIFLQLKHVLGINIKTDEIKFAVVLTLQKLVYTLAESNIVAVIMSTSYMFLMILNNKFVKPWLSEKTIIPFPIEFITLTIGTLLAYLCNMQEEYGLDVLGLVSTGFPEPVIPCFALIPHILFDALVLAVTSYAISMSVSLSIAQQRHYEVDANQELIAFGCSNCFGSFFSCLPISASFVRSIVQVTSGGVTQLASLISCFFLLLVLLWIAPFFETLPTCLLSSVIIVALFNMASDVFRCTKYWKLNKPDFIIWIVTFTTTTFIAMDIGLVSGILTSLLTVALRGYWPYSCILGVVPATNLYFDIERYQNVQEISRIKIFYYSGSIDFSSKASFRSNLFNKTGCNPQLILNQRQTRQEIFNKSDKNDNKSFLKFVIVDFTAVTYVDSSGVNMINGVFKEYKEVNVELCLCIREGPVLERIKICVKYENKKLEYKIFPCVHDAVCWIQSTTVQDKQN